MPWQIRNATPSRMVAPSHNSSLPRLFAIRFQCAKVTVTPDVSSSTVLSAGSPQAAMGVNGSVSPGPEVGHWPVKLGHSSSWCSRSPSSGTDMRRSQNSAPKKQAKNITSEKMNQLMPQRNDRSSQRPYLPPSDSLITSPNQRVIM